MNNWKEKLVKLQQASKDLNDDLKAVTNKVNEQVSQIEIEMERIKKRMLIDEMNELTDVMNSLFQNEYLGNEYPELSNKIYQVMQEIDHIAVELEEEWEEEVNNHYANN
jgi:predicted  nucleic acid-binding Zn-ribbon protein